MRALVTLIVAVTPGVALAQSPTPAVPSSAEAATTMVRAAGMPLADGTLPPGMLTVRVVEGSFTGNISGQAVTVEVGGRSETATTGADGRAEFAHLPIGSSVRATAVVRGQRLSSETFPMPSESGVRVLLMAGEGAAAPVPGPVPVQDAPTPERPRSVWIIAGALMSATLFALVLLLGRRR